MRKLWFDRLIMHRDCGAPPPPPPPHPPPSPLTQTEYEKGGRERCV